ncbi:hypothetical protein SAMN05518801_1521 [Novosphingobium sp. CF614]|nr:hypothetical protein SAMN05518801_1521 [Novosphingobium sp. CF614]
MGHFSVEIYTSPGATLSGNQHKDGQSYFNRIGAGFPHKDGNGMDVVLNSVPVDGRVTLRTAQDRLDTLKQGKAEPSQGRDQERGE